MKVDLSKYKKTDETRSTAVFSHPDGHSISIDKKKLSPKMRDQLKKLALHKVNGGMINDPDSEENQSFAKPQDDNFASIMNDISNSPGPNLDMDSSPMGNRAPAGMGADIGDWIHDKVKAYGDNFSQTPIGEMYQGAKDFGSHLLGIQNADGSVTAPPVVANGQPSNINLGMSEQSPQQVQMPNPYAQYGQSLQNAMNMGMHGIDAQAQAAGDFGAKQADLYQNNAQALQELGKHYQAASNDLMSERQNLVNDYKAGHIDPNHYMANKSTGQKIAQAIGLFLTTAGSSLLKTDNPFLKFMNNQIDRDIEAQKANLDKKKTLLGANAQQFQNLKDATLMTRVNMNDILTNQVEEAAARSASPQAKAAAEQLKSHMMMQNAQLMQPIIQNQAAMRMMNSGAMNSNPGLAIRMMVPKEQQSAAMKELGTAQNFETQKKHVMDAFDMANSQNTVLGRAMHGGFEPASVAAIKNLVMPYLKDAEGRINETEINRLDSLIPSPGDGPEKIAQKRNALISFMNEKGATPLLDAYGIRIPKSAGVAKRISGAKRRN